MTKAVLAPLETIRLDTSFWFYDLCPMLHYIMTFVCVRNAYVSTWSKACFLTYNATLLRPKN